MIATAASMQYPMETIVQAFEEKYEINCEIIIGSSGKHTAQILSGAPFDIFISADTIYPNELVKLGITEQPPFIYASGKLIVWSFIDSSYIDPHNWPLSTINHIALANPKTAPYGKLAYDYLVAQNIWPNIEEKIVYAESVSQTNQFIYSKAAEVGLTASSSVYIPNLKERGYYHEVENIAIPQAGIILSDNRSEAEIFRKFMLSEEVKVILLSFRYEPYIN